MRYQLGKLVPLVDQSCFIAPNASVIGNVELKPNASIWFNVVMRGDMDKITIGEDSNIQDGSILHVDKGFPIEVGKQVTVGHKVMLHGCTIGDLSLIGMNAVVLNGAKIGKGCIIGANSLVTEGMEVPDGHLALGSPAKVIKPLDEKTRELLMQSAEHYVQNGQRYTDELVAIED
ncbi:gamma carbonic anhydrase family protein [Thalassotalea euphylliae]|uniref:Gamma carbonic anhydrase family protein n=1 Tax=Thalassotalea euphylliae TaxID=1655234 RepID=A0A3E0TS32_9GAMM|nr:gamma carbonic anhydrase family protein [Thalassotalea euphylliae]REL27451.1 gamma carbonic anhydrase family protein [Thalassotalea euphylliae]REL32471.1 gamma carbonic anhydrase family protein [Thalassotalea euphylliae]